MAALSGVGLFIDHHSPAAIDTTKAGRGGCGWRNHAQHDATNDLVVAGGYGSDLAHRLFAAYCLAHTAVWCLL